MFDRGSVASAQGRACRDRNNCLSLIMSNFQNGVQLSVAGKVALITGGSRGIGAATVKMFCAAGAKVAFNYKKAKDAADRVIAECGTNVCAIQSDLSSPGDAEQLIKVVVGNLGRLDCLVANHGIWPPDDAPVDEMPDDQWRRTIAVNLDSVFGLIKHGVAQMKSQRRGPGQAAGRIVIISSTAGQRGEAFHCDYAASKGEVIGMVIQPEEIASPILFLCTDHAGFITGEILNVNGGAVLVG